MDIISSNKLYDPIYDSQDKEANMEMLNWIANYSGGGGSGSNNQSGSTVMVNNGPPRKSVLGKRGSILSNTSDSKKNLKKNVTIPDDVSNNTLISDKGIAEECP